LEKSLKKIYPFGANLYQKLPILAILGAVSLHLQSDNGEIWREGTDLDTFPALNFAKIAQGDLSFGRNFYLKNRNFHDF